MSQNHTIPSDFEPISADSLEHLESYLALLLKWNKAYNLVGQTTLDDPWNRHIIDSLQLSEHIPTNATVADFGTGAGIPGMILAIARPDATFHLIESNQKKMLFLKEVLRQLPISNVHLHHDRIESLVPWPCDVVTARAFAPLDRLLNYTFPFIKPNTGTAVLLKGKSWEDEMKNASLQWDFIAKQHPTRVEENRESIPSGYVCLLTKIARKRA